MAVASVSKVRSITAMTAKLVSASKSFGKNGVGLEIKDKLRNVTDSSTTVTDKNVVPNETAKV